MKRLGLISMALIGALACGGERGTYRACETFRGFTTEGSGEPPYKLIFDPKLAHERGLGARFVLTASDKLIKSLKKDQDYMIVRRESRLVSKTETECTQENRVEVRLDNYPIYPGLSNN